LAPAYGNVLRITTGGTAGAPITFEAAPGQTPIIDSSGVGNGIYINRFEDSRGGECVERYLAAFGIPRSTTMPIIGSLGRRAPMKRSAMPYRDASLSSAS